MQNLVSAILDVSQLESRQMPVERAPVQLSALVAEVLQLQLSLAEQKQISFENNLSADLPPAWADARLVERVLQNLIGNALKHTPAGGAIRIAAQPTSSAPPMLSVSVSDTGSGIPSEIQGRLFQKFVTGEQKGHGSGLGLAFCRLAVEAHGGRIWAESDSGSGATFTFTLPLYQPGD
jgi:signal transduction histidine kinase